MEHIEEAGVHSGDSACAIPPPTLAARVLQTIERHTRALADALDVVGLLNVQYAVKDGQVFVIEANPRASRTVPFVSKATGVPLAKVAARLMVGATLEELRAEGLLRPPAEGGHVSVKEAVLPFNRFPDVDTLLGPEMRSTGEVMGIDRTFGMAFAKSQAGAGNTLPQKGTVFLSLADRDKAAGLVAARRFAELGFSIAATAGTAAALEAEGIAVDTVVAKVGETVGVDAVDLISSGKVDLVVNTPRGRGPRADGMHIRRAAIAHGVACVTTVAAAIAAAAGIAEAVSREPDVRSLQSTTATASCGSRSDRCGSAGAPRSLVDMSRRRSGPCPLPNPIVAASGTFGHGDEVADAVRSRAPRRGDGEVGRRVPVGGQPAAARHRAPAGGMLNSVGLPGPGVDAWIARDLPALEARGARVIASIWGRSVDDYAAAAAPLKAVADRVVAVEVNLSCPNVEARRDVFAHSPDATHAAITAVVDALGGLAARVREALAERHRHRRDRARRGRRGRGRAHARQHGDGTRDRRRDARAAARRGRRRVQRRADQADRAARGVGGRAGDPRHADHRHRRRVDRPGRGRDDARGRARGRRRHRDVRRPARAAAHRDEVERGARRTACPASAT